MSVKRSGFWVLIFYISYYIVLLYFNDCICVYDAINYQGGPRKLHTKLIAITLSMLTDFQNSFTAGKPSKFAAKSM